MHGQWFFPSPTTRTRPFIASFSRSPMMPAGAAVHDARTHDDRANATAGAEHQLLVLRPPRDVRRRPDGRIFVRRAFWHRPAPTHPRCKRGSPAGRSRRDARPRQSASRGPADPPWARSSNARRRCARSRQRQRPPANTTPAWTVPPRSARPRAATHARPFPDRVRARSPRDPPRSSASRTADPIYPVAPVRKIRMAESPIVVGLRAPGVGLRTCQATASGIVGTPTQPYARA